MHADHTTAIHLLISSGKATDDRCIKLLKTQLIPYIEGVGCLTGCLNAVDERHRTALYLAVERKFVDTAVYILATGVADVEIAAADSSTVLHMAVVNRLAVVVNKLLGHGAAVNRQDGGK